MLLFQPPKTRSEGGKWGRGADWEEIWGEGRSEGGERGEERERKKEGGLME